MKKFFLIGTRQLNPDALYVVEELDSQSLKLSLDPRAANAFANTPGSEIYLSSRGSLELPGTIELRGQTAQIFRDQWQQFTGEQHHQAAG